MVLSFYNEMDEEGTEVRGPCPVEGHNNITSWWVYNSANNKFNVVNVDTQ